MESIIQNEKKCFITGSITDLHCHHIFGGGLRLKSEKYGLKVWLRSDYHNMSDKGVHFNRDLDLMLKKIGQTVWQEKYGKTEQDFIKEFGKSWLDN